jgi:hypothetical protein
VSGRSNAYLLHNALVESITLALSSHMSWYTDLQNVLARLRCPVQLPLTTPSTDKYHRPAHSLRMVSLSDGAFRIGEMPTDWSSNEGLQRYGSPYHWTPDAVPPPHSCPQEPVCLCQVHLYNVLQMFGLLIFWILGSLAIPMIMVYNIKYCLLATHFLQWPLRMLSHSDSRATGGRSSERFIMSSRSSSTVHLVGGAGVEAGVP